VFAHEIVDSNVKGSLRAYATGIAYTRLFLRERRSPDDRRPWVPEFNPLHMYTVEYDYVTQTRTISLASKDNAPPTGSSSKRLSDAEIITAMNNLDSVQNVGMRPTVLKQSGVIDRRRTRCDMCIGAGLKDKCNALEDDLIVCNSCAARGYPVCSWTPDFIGLPKPGSAKATLHEKISRYFGLDVTTRDTKDAPDPGFEMTFLPEDVAVGEDDAGEGTEGEEDDFDD
jgi:hypothetical protein